MDLIRRHLMRRLYYAVAVTCSVLVLSAATQDHIPTGSSPINQQHVTPLKYPIHLISGHVLLGFADGSTTEFRANSREHISILSPLSYFITSGSGQLSGSLSRTVVASAHAHQVAVWPMVEAGFAPARTTALLSHPAAQLKLLSAITKAVLRDHADGINLDFEDMIPADASRLTAFTQKLATALHKMGKGLSVDITPPSPDPNWGNVYDRSALAKAADYTVLMSYDEHYGGDPLPGSVASLPWLRTSLRATLKAGVPSAKLLLGIPFYTRDWFHANGTLTSTYISLMQEIADESRQGAKVGWNAHAEQQMLTFKEAGVWHTIWLENATSLRERGAVTRQFGVAGAAIWQLELGDSASLASVISGITAAK